MFEIAFVIVQGQIACQNFNLFFLNLSSATVIDLM